MSHRSLILPKASVITRMHTFLTWAAMAWSCIPSKKTIRGASSTISSILIRWPVTIMLAAWISSGPTACLAWLLVGHRMKGEFLAIGTWKIEILFSQHSEDGHLFALTLPEAITWFQVLICDDLKCLQNTYRLFPCTVEHARVLRAKLCAAKQNTCIEPRCIQWVFVGRQPWRK